MLCWPRSSGPQAAKQNGQHLQQRRQALYASRHELPSRTWASAGWRTAGRGSPAPWPLPAAPGAGPALRCTTIGSTAASATGRPPWNMTTAAPGSSSGGRQIQLQPCRRKWRWRPNQRHGALLLLRCCCCAAPRRCCRVPASLVRCGTRQLQERRSQQRCVPQEHCRRQCCPPQGHCCHGRRCQRCLSQGHCRRQGCRWSQPGRPPCAHPPSSAPPGTLLSLQMAPGREGGRSAGPLLVLPPTAPELSPALPSPFLPSPRRPLEPSFTSAHSREPAEGGLDWTHGSGARSRCVG